MEEILHQFKSYFIGVYMCEENIYQTNTTVIHYFLLDFDTSQVPGGAGYLKHQTVTCKRDTLRRALRLVAARTPLERVVEAAGAIEDENHKRYQKDSKNISSRMVEVSAFALFVWVLILLSFITVLI